MTKSVNYNPKLKKVYNKSSVRCLYPDFGPNRISVCQMQRSYDTGGPAAATQKYDRVRSHHPCYKLFYTLISSPELSKLNNSTLYQEPYTNYSHSLYTYIETCHHFYTSYLLSRALPMLQLDIQVLARHNHIFKIVGYSIKAENSTPKIKQDMT